MAEKGTDPGFDFEKTAWMRMEHAYQGFLRSLWREDPGCYVESQTAMLGKYHVYRNKNMNWASEEDGHRALRMMDYFLDPQFFGPREWVGHPAGVWMTVRFLCLMYRYRKEMGIPDSKAKGIRSLLDVAVEKHLWSRGSSEHTNQEAYNLYVTDAWHCFKVFREKKYWEWVLHFLGEIQRRYRESCLDDMAGSLRHRYLQPDLTFNYANDKSSEGHPQNLHTPNYHDTHIGEFICMWQEMREVVDYRNSFIEDHISALESSIFYDWMYDGSPSCFSDGYGIHRMHHGLTWASMLVFPIALAYHRAGSLRGVGRFLLEQFVRSIPGYDVMEGDPEDGAIPPAYFGTRHQCGMKGEGNGMWLQRLSKALVEYRVQDVEPEPLECWTDFRDWNQGAHYSGKVFDLGVIGRQMYRESDGIGMQTSLGEPTVRDTRTGRIVVASSADPPNSRVPESGADFLFQPKNREPLWLSEESEGRRATVFSFRSSRLPDWIEHLTPYRCHELDGKRENPHWVDVHTEVVRPREPRFAGGNCVRATRDVVVQVSYLVNLQGSLEIEETGKFYSWMRDEEMAFVCRGDGGEENLGIHVPLEFPVFPATKRVNWFWARYASHGMLFIPVWEEMEGMGEGWRLDIDRSNVHLGKYFSQGLGSYSLRGGGTMKMGEGWRTCMVLRPTADSVEEARALARFYRGAVEVEGEGVKLGARSFHVPELEIAEQKRGDRPWDVVVEGVRPGNAFRLSGVGGRGVMTVTLRGEGPFERIEYAYDGSKGWQEAGFDQPQSGTAVFSLPWDNAASAEVQVR